jgi:D-alanine-D-alanine ligase
VLVVDTLPKNRDTPAHLRHDLEMMETETLDGLLRALRELGIYPTVYPDPRTLSENAHLHRDELVWPLYSGQASRNRLALVPAICESHGLRYIGPDAYGQVICQDKEISKNLARSFGLITPRHQLLRTTNDVIRIATLLPPYVLKPVREGTSIGISQRNLVRHPEDGMILALELLREFSEPILVEDFVEGREVSYNYIAGTPESHWSFSEIHVEAQDDYFDSHLFDADEKLHRHLPRRVRNIDKLLAPEDHLRLNDFIRAIGTIIYGRIDGKLRDGRFVFLEATPDAYISQEAAFSASFLNKGWTYTKVIAAILQAATRDLHDRSANG